MSNLELTKHYMGLQQNTNKMPEVVYTDIISALNRHFNGQWTWELADERFAMDNTTVCTTITLYTPGRVYTGRSLCKIKDYASNHLFAILNACESFIDSSNIATTSLSNQPVGEVKQMTPDQIMNAINATNQQPQQQVNTAAQFYNYKDENGIQGNGVPFDAVTDNCHKELQQEMIPTPVSQPQQSAPAPQQNATSDYDAPQERYKGFSQHQIDRLNKFKADFDIINDEMFGNYVNTWNKTLTSKKDITPANANDFLAWAENLGKMDC